MRWTAADLGSCQLLCAASRHCGRSPRFAVVSPLWSLTMIGFAMSTMFDLRYGDGFDGRCAFSKHRPPENYVIGALSDNLKLMAGWVVRWLSAARTRLRQRLDLLLEFIALRLDGHARHAGNFVNGHLTGCDLNVSDHPGSGGEKSEALTVGRARNSMGDWRAPFRASPIVAEKTRPQGCKH